MQRNSVQLRSAVVAPLPFSATFEPVSGRVADLLAAARSIPKYGDYGYEGQSEFWEPKAVTAADAADLRRQLAIVEAACAPGDPGTVMGRVYALLSHYRGHELPEAVERAMANEWLEDIGEFPAAVVDEACRRWRRNPAKFKYRPLPGDIRTICDEIMGKLPTIRDRLRRLLASIPTSESTDGRTGDIKDRILRLAAARRMP